MLIAYLYSVIWMPIIALIVTSVVFMLHIYYFPRAHTARPETDDPSPYSQFPFASRELGRDPIASRSIRTDKFPIIETHRC